MKISICIPVKNRAENLLRCIESIYKLSGDIEVVIADNNSTDINFEDLGGPYGKLEKTHPTKIVFWDGDWSTGRAKNVAAETSTGDILFFLDADLVLLQSAIDRILAFVPLGWVYAPIMWMQNEDRVTGDWATNSYGQVAVTREQWENHKWVEWTSYGADDNMFIEPYGTQGTDNLLRDTLSGFVHLWHSHDERNKYYKNPSGYDANLEHLRRNDGLA
jgi:glycosyltransferase involved in cell wall biosynthesis